MNSILCAQEMLLEIMSEQFGMISKDTIEFIQRIKNMSTLKTLAREVIQCKGMGQFEALLVKVSEGKLRKTKSSTRRGTDEAFYRLMGISGAAVIKLLGFDIDDPENYRFKAIVLKDKRLEPDIEGIPMLETKGKKIFLEFQGYYDKFIRYRTLANALTGCAQEQYEGKVCLGIIYTNQSFQKAAKDIELFTTINPKSVTSEIKEIVLTGYTVQQLIDIDPRLIVLAPFTVKRQTQKQVLSSQCREWKTYIEKNYAKEEKEEAIKLVGLFLYSRFSYLTREELIAMLNFDLMKTVAGRQIYEEGIEIGEKRGKKRGIELTCSKLMEAGVISGNQVLQVAAMLGLNKKDLNSLISEVQS